MRLERLIAAEMIGADALSRESVDAIRAAKMSGDLPRVRTRAAGPESVDEASRTIRYVYSDETPDRYGDIIRASGWDLSDYQANNVALWQHDMDRPIGTGTGIAVQNKALVGGIQYAAEGTSAWHDTVWKLAKQGILKAVSVGFDPLERVWHDDDEARAKMGLGAHGVEYVRQSLLEISLVSIPANPSAMQLALRPLIDAGELSDGEADAVLRAQVTEMDMDRRLRAIRRRTVTVDWQARAATAEQEVTRLRGLLAALDAERSARTRADAAAADVRAAQDALMQAAEVAAVQRGLESFTRTVRAKGGTQ